MAQRSINSDAEYESALIEIEKFFDNEPEKGSVEAAAFDEMTQLISDYEDRFWPINRLSDSAGRGGRFRSKLAMNIGVVQRPSRLMRARVGRQVCSPRFKAAARLLKDRQIERKRPVSA